jgi:uncharacterized protein
MDPLDRVDDATAAAAFRRLVHHLRHRTDAENIELMGLAGFCRNCLSAWVAEAAQDIHPDIPPIDWDEAREAVYGMPYREWKAQHQRDATPEQLHRMRESVARNASHNPAQNPG